MKKQDLQDAFTDAVITTHYILFIVLSIILLFTSIYIIYCSITGKLT